MAGIRNWFRKRADSKMCDVAFFGDIQYEMVRIPAGSYNMGSPENEKGRVQYEDPAHRVDLPEFFMGRYPVTNQQYGLYLAANPDVREPEYWGNREFNGPDQPVVGISWDEARTFARWAGLGLPSESQWEYGCRAGTTTRFYTGDTEKMLARAGWCNSNSDGRLHPAGEKRPNDFGLYDMHGNVWEWVEDHWHPNYKGAPDDGSAWIDTDTDKGSLRVMRGGSFGSDARYCRSAYRLGSHPSSWLQVFGFRLVLPPRPAGIGPVGPGQGRRQPPAAGQAVSG
jgi:formylglycine-generating enzyme required for sulfatase activity